MRRRRKLMVEVVEEGEGRRRNREGGRGGWRMSRNK